MKDFDEIKCQNKIIEGHGKKGISEKIQVVQETMKKFEMEIREIKNKKEDSGKKINNIKKGITNQELVERELNDNLRYRRKTIETENLRKEVEDMEKKFGNANFDGLLREKRNLKSKEDDIGKRVGIG